MLIHNPMRCTILVVCIIFVFQYIFYTFCEGFFKAKFIKSIHHCTTHAYAKTAHAEHREKKQEKAEITLKVFYFNKSFLENPGNSKSAMNDPRITERNTVFPIADLARRVREQSMTHICESQVNIWPICRFDYCPHTKPAVLDSCLQRTMGKITTGTVSRICCSGFDACARRSFPVLECVLQKETVWLVSRDNLLKRETFNLSS